MTEKKKISEEEFDKLVDSIQQQSFDDALDAYGERGFDRWRNPKYNVPVNNPDSVSAHTGVCGDRIEIALKFNKGIIAEASYSTDGCASSMLAGSFTAELAIGKDVDGLFSISSEDVINAIGKLPDDDSHCANLAVEVLHDCVNKYMLETK